MMLTQALAGPFGVADAAARKLLAQAMPNGGYPQPHSDLVQTVRRAYARMPAAARGPATTAAFAWARRYVESPAFATAYAEVRNGQKPAGAATNVDAQMKKYLDEAAAGAEMNRQIAAKLPPTQRDQLLAEIKQREDLIKSPEHLAQMRKIFGGAATDASDRVSKATTEWAAKFPENPAIFVRGCLERFMTATANVDFTLPTHWIRDAAGQVVGFQSPGYTGLSWEQIHAIVAGKEALEAARAAVVAWLKELG
jgi:hypothetical protein